MVNGGGMEGRTEGRKDGRTSGNSPLCSTGHRPFGAAAQKVAKVLDGQRYLLPLCECMWV